MPEHFSGNFSRVATAAVETVVVVVLEFFALIKAASANAVPFLPLHMTEEQISPRAHGPQITVSLAPVLLLLLLLLARASSFSSFSILTTTRRILDVCVCVWVVNFQGDHSLMIVQTRTQTDRRRDGLLSKFKDLLAGG